MAARFIGLHMRVVLREPAGYQLNGTVRDVEAGSSLTLINVFVSGTNEWAPETRIDASNIADLSEIKSSVQQPAYYTSPEPVVSAPPVQPPPPAQAPLDDPAILSLGRHPAHQQQEQQQQQQQSPPPPPPQENPEPVATAASPLVEEVSPTLLAALEGSDSPGVLQGIHVGRRHSQRSLSPIPDLSETIPLEYLHLENGVTERSGSGKPSVDESSNTKQRKRRRRQKKQVDTVQQESDTALEQPPTTTTTKTPKSGRGKGWRQTPMLESTASFQPFTSLKRLARGRKGNGDAWASEDVTEEMGEFDFENNLAKFDKRKIFDQMRMEDQVDDGDRLVAFNRKPKPGTNGGKNLHYTENVLDLPSAIAKNAEYWNSEADDPHGLDSTERSSAREARAPSMRRAESKNGVSKRSQSRKASQGIISSQPLTRVSSTQQLHRPGLYLIPSNRRLETVSALQMLNLENIAANEVGFTEDLMAENAGRGVAEVAVRALCDPALKVRFEMSGGGTSLDSSMTVILAGNNKSSVRAMAAARHLRNRNYDVVVCLIGIERERDLLEDLRRQIDLYRSFGGRVMSKTEFFEYLRKNTAAGSKVPISLIMDALIGLTTSFEELRVGDQAAVYELMEWANRNEAIVLSVDVPSGIDPTSGKIALIDGSPLFVKPRYVVAIGAPKRGLLEAVTPPDDDTAQEDDWRLFIADMGLGSAVWRKAGTKMRRGIDFNGNWVLEMQYRAYGQSSSE